MSQSKIDLFSDRTYDAIFGTRQKAVSTKPAVVGEQPVIRGLIRLSFHPKETQKCSLIKMSTSPEDLTPEDMTALLNDKPAYIFCAPQAYYVGLDHTVIKLKIAPETNQAFSDLFTQKERELQPATLGSLKKIALYTGHRKVDEKILIELIKSNSAYVLFNQQLYSVTITSASYNIKKLALAPERTGELEGMFPKTNDHLEQATPADLSIIQEITKREPPLVKVPEKKTPPRDEQDYLQLMDASVLQYKKESFKRFLDSIKSKDLVESSSDAAAAGAASVDRPLEAHLCMPSDEVISRKFDDFKAYYPLKTGDHAALIKFFKLCKVIADYYEDNNSAANFTAYEHAYKLLILFGAGPVGREFSKIEAFFRAHPNLLLKRKPLHDLLVRSIPMNDKDPMPIKTLEAWQSLIARHGEKVISLFQSAVEINKKCVNQKPCTLEEAMRARALLTYPRYNEHTELADLCARYNQSEAIFNRCLEISPRQKTRDNLPNVIVEGAKVGCPGYYLVKLPIDDPRAYLLGEITNCCQSIGSHSEQCVIDGITRENNGFYVLLKSKSDQIIGQGDERKSDDYVANELPSVFDESGHIRYDQFDIRGQGYAWISKTDNLVFDSWENVTPDADDPIIVPMLQEFGKMATRMVTNPDLLRVTLGLGGKTPAAMKANLVESPEFIKEGIEYGDAKRQALCYLNLEKLQVLHKSMSQVFAALRIDGYSEFASEQLQKQDGVLPTKYLIEELSKLVTPCSARTLPLNFQGFTSAQHLVDYVNLVQHLRKYDLLNTTDDVSGHLKSSIKYASLAKELSILGESGYFSTEELRDIYRTILVKKATVNQESAIGHVFVSLHSAGVFSDPDRAKNILIITKHPNIIALRAIVFNLDLSNFYDNPIESTAFTLKDKDIKEFFSDLITASILKDKDMIEIVKSLSYLNSKDVQTREQLMKGFNNPIQYALAERNYKRQIIALHRKLSDDSDLFDESKQTMRQLVEEHGLKKIIESVCIYIKESISQRRSVMNIDQFLVSVFETEIDYRDDMLTILAAQMQWDLLNRIAQKGDIKVMSAITGIFISIFPKNDDNDCNHDFLEHCITDLYNSMEDGSDKRDISALLFNSCPSLLIGCLMNETVQHKKFVLETLLLPAEKQKLNDFYKQGYSRYDVFKFLEDIPKDLRIAFIKKLLHDLPESQKELKRIVSRLSLGMEDDDELALIATFFLEPSRIDQMIDEIDSDMILTLHHSVPSQYKEPILQALLAKKIRSFDHASCVCRALADSSMQPAEAAQKIDEVMRRMSPDDLTQHAKTLVHEFSSRMCEETLLLLTDNLCENRKYSELIFFIDRDYLPKNIAGKVSAFLLKEEVEGRQVNWDELKEEVVGRQFYRDDQRHDLKWKVIRKAENYAQEKAAEKEASMSASARHGAGSPMFFSSKLKEIDLTPSDSENPEDVPYDPNAPD